jgi:plasmid stability protein
MPTLTLKAIPIKLHRELKNRAKAHHRSLNKEVIAMLEQATAGSAKLDVQEMLDEARRARSHFTRSVTAKEVSGWVNQGRL